MADPRGGRRPDRRRSSAAGPTLPRGSVRARLGTIRARSTLVAVLVVGAALTVGALALLALLRSSLEEGVESTAQTQLRDVSALVRAGDAPVRLPAVRGDILTQLVGPGGRVLADSVASLGARPMSRLHPGEEGTLIRAVTQPAAGDDDGGSSGGPYLLMGSRVDPPGPGGPVTVYVAGSLRPMVEATSTLGVALALGLPPLVALVGILVWTLSGRALRPVETIRAEVADISGHALDRRVPVSPVEDEVARLARTMNEMLDRLERSAVTQRRFVSDASHELRSPLAALRATLEVAMAHPDDSAWRASATDALDEATRLQRLVDDLLALALADESPVPARRDVVDLDELVLREARLTAANGSVVLDLHRLSGGRVRGDARQLTRVVHNLMDNARRHASARVEVELCSCGDEVLLVVADDGPGIDRRERERVFDRFARLDQARRHDAGTGLGLAIVREIVLAHHGSVVVADSDRGARFEVRLPGDDQASPEGGPPWVEAGASVPTRGRPAPGPAALDHPMGAQRVDG